MLNTAFIVEKHGNIYLFKVTFEETGQRVHCQAKCYIKGRIEEENRLAGTTMGSGFSYSQAYLDMLDNIKPLFDEIGRFL